MWHQDRCICPPEKLMGLEEIKRPSTKSAAKKSQNQTQTKGAFHQRNKIANCYKYKI